MTIAAVCTTMGRPERHEGLYKVFASQTAPDKSLHILDESPEPSPFFSSLADPRVHYRHEPSSGKRGDVTTIGASRNRLMASLPPEVTHVAHFDDDDLYAPEYLSEMRRRLGRDDLVKLSVWNALLEHDGTIWQWDTTKSGGKHFAVKGSEVPIELDVPPADPMTADWTLWGYGFSYVFRKDLWERHRFPDEGTEDYFWVAECRRAGARCVLVGDAPELCLHTVHPKSESAIFPQKRLAAVPEGVALRSLAAAAMAEQARTMYRLPSERDIEVEGGAAYHVLAYLKKKHSLRALAVRAGSWGASVIGARDDVPAAEVGLPAAPEGYRIVQVLAHASRDGYLPWKVPDMLEAVLSDRSRVVVAWSDRPPPMAVTVPHELGLHFVEYRRRRTVAAPPPPPPVGGRLLSTTSWWAFAIIQGNTVKVLAADLAADPRPDPTSPPDQINAWLGRHSLSPIFLYPEFQWNFDYNAGTAWAAYDLDASNHVSWTASTDGTSGQWHYDHVTSPSVLGIPLNNLATALADVAAAAGFVFAAFFVNTLQAIGNHQPIGQLAQSFKQDWDTMSGSAQIAFALYDGDYQKAWNAATADGKNLVPIEQAFAPGPAPDIHGNLSGIGLPVPAPSGGALSSIWAVLTGAIKVSSGSGTIKAPPASKTAASTIGTVAIVGGSVLAAGAIGTSLYAWHTHRTFGQALKALTRWPWTRKHDRLEARRR